MTSAGIELLDALRCIDPPDSDQLELPWGGRSPRVLTEAWKRFKFVRETATLDEWPAESVIEEQCRRHFHGS